METRLAFYGLDAVVCLCSYGRYYFLVSNDSGQTFWYDWNQ